MSGCITKAAFQMSLLKLPVSEATLIVDRALRLLVLIVPSLWDAWKDPAQDQWLQSFTIITTPLNELTATVHNRMPVILHPDNYEQWLMRVDGETPSVALPRLFPADEMKS
jgi:putative SOS response-associated peptidase YedK